MNNLTQHQQSQIQPEYASYEDSLESQSESSTNIVRLVLGRWYIILLTFILVSGAGVPAVWYLILPNYDTTGAIEVAPILTNPLTGERDTGEISKYESFMNTQARIMTGNNVLQRVADNLKDKKLEFFNPPTDRVSQWKRVLSGGNGNSDPVVVLKGALAGGVISVTPISRTQWLGVTMTSRNPREAEQIVNSFIQAYMSVIESSSLEGENRRLNLLEDERKIILGKIQTQRAEIQSLAQLYGADSLEGLQNMMIKNVEVIQTELSNLENRRLQLQTQIELLSQPQQQSITPAEKISMRNEFINNDPFVQRLTANIAQMQQEYLIDEQDLSQSNPKLKKKAQLIETLQEKLDQSKEKAGKTFDKTIEQEIEQDNRIRLAQAEMELKKTVAYISSYAEKLEKERTNTIELGKLQWQIQDLREQMTFNKDEYDRYGQRIRELQVKLKLPARISVADRANTAPPKSRRNKMVVAVLFGALACGMFLAFMVGKADHSLHTPDDIVRCIGVPILGTTTNAKQMDKNLLPEFIANDYQTIRANLGLLSEGQIPKVLAVTSPAMGEGKTTLSINLAMSLAKTGNRVLLIDGDLRKPGIARMLNLPDHSWGLQDVLLGLKRFEETVRTLPLTGLDVMTTDHRNTTAAIEQLSRSETAECIKTISQQYDHVIIDTTPILAAPDALLWAKMADAAVISTLAGHTSGPDLKEALERLSRLKIRILGNVLNNVQAKHRYNRYGYSYYGGNGTAKTNEKKDKARPLLVSEDVESEE
jgi:polysaccharide biosynthesis transport protein